MNKTLAYGLGATVLALGAEFSASAADFQWNGTGETVNWGADKVWLNKSQSPAQAVTWVGNQVAIFPADSSLAHTINLEQTYAPGRMNVQDDYTFTGAESAVLNYDLGYAFYVSEGKTATFQVPFQQTSSDSNKRALFEPTGTIDFQKGGSVYRFQQNRGTVKVTGGTFTTTGSHTDAGASASVAGFTAGTFIVDGAKTKFEVGADTKYLPNSGTEIIVRNGGTFDASKVTGEVLNGFSNNGTGSSHASITVEDGGTFIANNLRVGKANKATFDAKPDYGRVNVNAGGIMRVHQMRMDDTGDWYGEVNFNGGTWELTCLDSEKGKEIYPFSANDATKWPGLHLTVRKGGARLLNTGDANYRHKILKPLKCGVAEGETDGGLTIEGTGLLYMNTKNTYNGPTTLAGTGGIIYVPYNDDALGAVPATPTDNIIAASSSPILHVDYACDFHKNRNVLIKKDITFQVGNGNNLRLLGQIKSDPEAPDSTVLRVRDSWAGALTIATTDGRENRIGRLRTDGHLVIADGTTTITKTSTDVHGSAPIYVARGSTATDYSKNYGVLEVTGGTLKPVTAAKYTETQNYGQIKVSGGKFDVSGTNQEILNGMDTPGRVEVSGTGEIAAYIVRATQVESSSTKAYGSDGLPATSVHVATGGVLRLHHFSIDYGKTSLAGRIDLDGGTIICRSSQNKLIGNPVASSRAKWEKIPVRVCPGGAIVDTASFTSEISLPLVSAGENDGGVRKIGTGKLNLSGANTYVGPTRCDKGQLVFTTDTSFPGGDLEVSVKELGKLSAAERQTALIKATRLAFKTGAKIRVVDFEGDDPFKALGKRLVLAQSDAEINRLPTVVEIDKDGQEIAGGRWAASLSADKKTLLFASARGLVLTVR